MIDDRYLIVRSAAVYIAAIAMIAAVAWRRPDRQTSVGAAMAFAWNATTLFALHLIATRFGWWHYDAQGGLLAGLPVDLWLAWAVLWGPVPAIAAARAPISAIAAAVFAVDLIAMPAAFPVVRLGPNWLLGEAVAVMVCLVPSQLLARWTAFDRHLTARASLQVAAFAILLLLLLPSMAISASGSHWSLPDLPRWSLSLIAQLLCVPGLIGVTAVQEFVTRGRGTPIPFDPPRRLVTTGIYSYVANPMQLAAVVFLFMLAAVIGNAYVALAAVMSHLYSVGLAGWDEDEDLRARFGSAWMSYRASARKWIPRWRPQPAIGPGSRLYVASECDKCQEVARWFRARGAVDLEIVPAGTFPQPLTRITYQSKDGLYTAAGIHAVARALEHINFAWALAGFAMRLPGLSAFIQLIVDASGGGPQLTGASQRESCDERQTISCC